MHCLDVLQINFDFCRVWLSFTWVIALCSKLVFRTFLSCLLRYLLEILYMHLSWCLTDKVWLLLHLTYIYMSYCPLFKFIFTDFSQLSLEIFNLWVCICLVVLQIKFHFCCVWPTFTWVISLGSKLVFQTFLSCYCHLLEILCMHLSWCLTDQVWLLSRLSYYPFFKISFPNFSTTWFNKVVIYLQCK